MGDVEVEAFLFGWFSAQSCDDEAFADWSVGYIDAKRESGKLARCRCRVLGVGGEEYEFPAYILFDSVVSAPAS